MITRPSCFVSRINGLQGAVKTTVRRGSHAHRPPPPPFARLPPPKTRLHEDCEVVWNDGVAPETLLDFEASHVSKMTSLRHLFYGFAFLGSVMGIVVLYDPRTFQQAELRRESLQDLRWEMGEIDEAESEMTG